MLVLFLIFLRLFLSWDEHLKSLQLPGCPLLALPQILEKGGEKSTSNYYVVYGLTSMERDSGILKAMTVFKGFTFWRLVSP